MNAKHPFQPDYAVHPGFTLREKLEELNLSSKEFAVRTGKPEKTISAIINGKSAITPDMAVLFEKVLQIPANFWLKKQTAYDEAVAREKQKQQLAQQKQWLKEFPYAEMLRLGLVPPVKQAVEKIEALFNFFNISRPEAWEDIYLNQKLQVAFRISLQHQKNPHALSVLFRLAEVEASKIKTPPYSKKRLQQLLPVLKELVNRKPADYLSQIQSLLQGAGVKVVYTPSLKGTVLNGTVRWLNHTPVLQLTDRSKRYDIFVFTLFHEIGHILLHPKKTAVYLENIDENTEKDQHELEADEFAGQILISPEQFEKIDNLIQTRASVQEIVSFYSQKWQIHPSILAGRILKEYPEFYKKGLLKYIDKIDFKS